MLVVGADAVADLAATVLRDATNRARPPFVYPRPRPLVAVPHSDSFPSGHTATSFACATVLSAAFPRAAPGFFLLAAAIGFSRIYVGVHWPLDVLGGAILGVAVGLAVVRLARSRVPTSLRRP